jgi:hypothetical protein
VKIVPKSTTSLRIDAERNRVHEKDREFEPHDDYVSSLKRPGEGSALGELLRWLTRSLAVMAVVSSFALLCVGATPMLSHLPAYIASESIRWWALLKTLPLSSLPLLLAGSSYIVLQAILRPRPLELLKRLMLGSAFLLWGIVQLMPASDLANELGNIVIALYVVDLGLMIWTDLEKNQPRLAG